MKPGAKKTLIVVAALAVAGAVVYYYAYWRHSVNGIIARLDTDRSIKKLLREYSKVVLNTDGRDFVEEHMEEVESFNMKLVYSALIALQYRDLIAPEKAYDIFEQLESMKP